jgi:hypothetical protein
MVYYSLLKMLVSKTLTNMITFALFVVLTIMSKNAVAAGTRFGNDGKCINNASCGDDEVCLDGECKDLATKCETSGYCDSDEHCVDFEFGNGFVRIHPITCSSWHKWIFCFKHVIKHSPT